MCGDGPLDRLEDDGREPRRLGGKERRDRLGVVERQRDDVVLEAFLDPDRLGRGEGGVLGVHSNDQLPRSW